MTCAAFQRMDVYRLSEKLSDALWELTTRWQSPRLNAYLKSIDRRPTRNPQPTTDVN